MQEARRIGTILVLLLAAFVFCAAAQAQVSVQMSANRNRLTTDESVVVQIEVAVNGGEEPDIELPSFDKFEIVQQQVSRPMQFSFSFGTNRGTQRMFRSTTQYTFVLRPYQEGTITIAPVRVSLGGKDYKSNALNLVVGKGSSPSAPADPTQSQQQTDDDSQSATDYVDATDFDRKAFLRTVVDKAEAFVGEQVTATIYLYVRSRLTSNPSIESEPNTEGFWIHDLMQAKANLRPRRQIVKGIPFTVYPLRRFAAFPLRSGELSIGSMTVSIERNSLFDLFNRGGFEPTLRRASIPVTIQVKDLPEKDKPQDEVAVGSFSVSAKFDRNQVATGDAVKLTATVTGSGNLRTVSLPEPKISGVQVLKPEIRDLIESPNDLVGGTKVFEWLLIPQSPGEIKIGTIDLPVFNPEEKRYRIERSEPLTLTVVGRSIITKEDDETTATEPSAEQKEDAANAFGPIRTSSALSRNPSRLIRTAWYYWVLALGPSLWLLILGASAVRRRLEANSQKTAPKRAVREAKQRLSQTIGRASRGDTKSYYGDIAAAITTVLEVRLGEAIGGYTLTELRARLKQRGMNEQLASQVVKQLETCDFLRFGSAGTSPDEIKEHARTARELFQQLQDFTPTTEEVKA